MRHMNEVPSFPDRAIDQISEDAIEIGSVVAIYVYPVQREPSRSLKEVRAVAGQGLSGDHKRNPHRAVTLLSLQDWDKVTAELKSDYLQRHVVPICWFIRLIHRLNLQRLLACGYTLEKQYCWFVAKRLLVNE